MFYSHQLLARKAPLGQIWMAATMHAKINRKKLCKLNIIKICEEILNPSVPMALRLSGILMGGVVIVYERKVKLLYDDVSRLLVELNEAWKIKAIPDPTVLPKGKTQARYEAVTLPDDCDMEFEHSVSFSAAAEELPRKGFRMQLDDVDEGYININPDDDGIPEKHHQADAANITLFDGLHASFQQEDLCKRFERFDVEGDDETQINFTPIDEGTGIPTTLVPSPPPPPDHHMEDQRQHQTESEQPREREKESPASGEDAKEQIQAKRKSNSKLPRLAMDEGLLIIQADVYHTWLQDASNIISKKPRQAKQHSPMQYRKISELMELPPVALISGLDDRTCQIHYPEPLLRLWLEDRPSEGASPKRSRGPSTYSRTEGLYPRDVTLEDLGSEADSRTMEPPIEKLRANVKNLNLQVARDAFPTPESPGTSAKSAPSSGSGPSIYPQEPEVRLSSGRSKRRQHSSSNKSFGSLDPVEEDMPSEENTGDFKLRRVSENGLTPDFDLNTELLEETAPLPTPNLVIPDPTVDKVTQTIRTHLKTHFDTLGAPDFESLNLLAAGMNKQRAAQLFYQTCVLATLDIVKVEQTVPYGDISISRGLKM